jgi:hypothetical protein
MDTLPWYRQPWPWFLIALPAVAVVGSVATAVLAVRSNDEPVATDYYRRGLEINAKLARRERAAQLGLTVELAVEGLRANDRVALRVAGLQPLPPDAAVQLRLVVPGRPQAERMLVLARVPRSKGMNEALFEATWQENEGGLGAGAFRQWSVQTSTWLVDGDADWHENDGPSSLTARASARP